MMKMTKLIHCGLPVDILNKITAEPTEHVRVQLFNALQCYEEGQPLAKPKLFGFMTFRVNDEMYNQLNTIAKDLRMSVKDVSAALLLIGDDDVQTQC